MVVDLSLGLLNIRTAPQSDSRQHQRARSLQSDHCSERDVFDAVLRQNPEHRNCGGG
jgi:hypothetical protein